jgi:hypothetical protein
MCSFVIDYKRHFDVSDYYFLLDTGPRSLRVETSERQTNSTCSREGLLIQFTFSLLALRLS